MRDYIKNITNVLNFYDFQPLLFFWILSDLFNNQVLYTTYDYWLELGQPNTYWLYMCYFFASLSIIICLNNLNRLIKCVSIYLILYLFSTVRYCVSIYTEKNGFLLEDFRALFITAWYFSMWVWILIKLKKEKLHKILRNG
mgnify:FL=1